MRRLFPTIERNGESEWSTDYTWLTAPWYPGIDRKEDLKRWWKRRKAIGEEYEKGG